MSKKFNEYRFNGLNYRTFSNKYYTMNRVSEDESRIVVKVADSQIFETAYGYGFIIDENHIVWLKDWAVSCNYYGNEVMLDKKYFKVNESKKPFADFAPTFGDIDDETGCKVGTWKNELAIAKMQRDAGNTVKWAK